VPETEPTTIGDVLREQMPVIKITKPEAASTSERLERALDLLEEFAKKRGVELKQIVLFSDIDGPLRDPIKQGLSGYPGRLPDGPLKVLEKAQEKGMRIAGFITEQPLEGHQIAKAVGAILGYQPMKEELSKVFPKAELVSSEDSWRFLNSKGRRDFVQKVNQIVGPYVNDPNTGLVCFVGDRFDVDGKLWQQVQQLQGEKASGKFVFIKVPSVFDTGLGKLASYMM